jgi:hypothetical protein
MSVRVLDDWELVWLLRGRATLTGDPGFELAAGDLVVLPPGHRHGFDWNPHGETEHGYVHFDLTDVTDGLAANEYRVLDHAATATGGRPVQMSMTRDDPLSGLCTYLLWLAATEPAGWQPALTHTVRHVLLHVFSQPHPPAEHDDTLPAPVQLAVDTCEEPGPARRWRASASPYSPGPHTCPRCTSAGCSSRCSDSQSRSRRNGCDACTRPRCSSAPT